MKYIITTIVCFFCVSCASLDKRAEEINMVTFNMRCDAEKSQKNWTGAWSLRKILIAQMMKSHDMDIVASQELYASQMPELKQMLRGEYDYVETQFVEGFDKSLIAGRNRPQADDVEIKMHNAIWYKTAKYEVLDKGSFYLSSTPEKFSFGFEPEAQCRRCVWAKFKSLEGGKTFYVFNVHADWQKRFSRLSSAKLVLSKIQSIASNSTVFLAGDFNDETYESADIFTSSNVLADSRKVTKAPPLGALATYHLWGTRDSKNPIDRLDYIFVSPDVKVITYKVLDDSSGGVYPSDHYPILTRALMGF